MICPCCVANNDMEERSEDWLRRVLIQYILADECILLFEKHDRGVLRLVPQSNTVPRVVRSRLADAIVDA